MGPGLLAGGGVGEVVEFETDLSGGAAGPSGAPGGGGASAKDGAGLQPESAWVMSVSWRESPWIGMVKPLALSVALRGGGEGSPHRSPRSRKSGARRDDQWAGTIHAPPLSEPPPQGLSGTPLSKGRGKGAPPSPLEENPG